MLKRHVDYTVPIGLLTCLFVLSFFKDDFTPDYLNTEAAGFLSPENGLSRILTIFSPYFRFWIIAFLYSLAFAILPYFIIHTTCDTTFARYVFYLFVAIFLGEYIMIFINHKFLDVVIIPKINRFYHSPIPSLFLIAAFTINARTKIQT